MNTLLNRRRMMGSKKSSLYDAEVEYLESAGNCTINTDFIPTGDDIRIQTKVLYNGYTDSTAWTAWFGAYINEQSNTYRIIRNNFNTQTILLYNGDIANGAGDLFYVTLNTIYNIDFNRNIYKINGSSGPFRTLKGAENSNPLQIFSPQFKGAFFFFRLWKNDVLMLDLIPVRKGTTGYMYDKVSGQLIGNGGTGQFILGPDVNSVNTITQNQQKQMYE